MTKKRTGGCHCGAVRYTITGPLRPPIACHCRQCRRMSGHYFAATQAHQRDFQLDNDSGLRWYQTSADVRRSFCGICGSCLFFERAASELISIAAGSVDEPTGMQLNRHIFVDEAGDYYEITDACPQNPGYPNALPTVEDDPLYQE